MTGHNSHDSALTRSSQAINELTVADSQSKICERIAAIAETVFQQLAVAVKLYDEDASRLKPTGLSTDAVAMTDDGHLFGGGRSQPWRVFATQERAVIPDILADETIDEDETQLRSAILFPLGSHGVFIAGATEPHAFDDAEINVATILVAITRSALDRVALKRELQTQQNKFEKLTEELDSIRRLNTLARELTTELLAAQNRDDICQRVCERLVSTDPYQFVWFGIRNPTSTEIIPKASAGDEMQLDGLTLTLDDNPSEHSVVSRAIKHRTPQADNAIHRDPPFEPWRDAAIQRGYRSSIAIPILYQGTLYGIISLYASETDVFDTFERTVLQELGGLIGYALNADERRQAFVSQQSVELAFAVEDHSKSLFSLVTAVGGTLTLENFIERPDGQTTLFFATEGVETNAVLQWATEYPHITDIRLLADRENECLFECVLDNSTVWSQLLQRGAVVRYARASSDSTRIVIRIPRTANPRSFQTVLEDHFGSVNLVARREYDEPILTAEQFEAAYKNRLTERQNEVLQTAYYAGYFESPRGINAGELADMLGIAQPTVSRHLRSSERKYLSMIYAQI